jgi:hypothetical protein
MVGQELDAFARRLLRRDDLPRVRRRVELRQAIAARGCHCQAGDRRDDAIEFEGS